MKKACFSRCNRRLVTQTLDLFKLQIVNKELIVNCNMPTEVVVQADYNMIFTTMRNLISNANTLSKEARLKSETTEWARQMMR